MAFDSQAHRRRHCKRRHNQQTHHTEGEGQAKSDPQRGRNIVKVKAQGNDSRCNKTCSLPALSILRNTPRKDELFVKGAWNLPTFGLKCEGYESGSPSPPSSTPSGGIDSLDSARRPRRNENTADPRIRNDKTIRECWSPARKIPASPLASWVIPPRPTFPKFTSLEYGTSVVISAKTSGMLATMLVLIMVDRTPDEMPLFALGTEPITELALGLRKSPIPNPTSDSQSAVSNKGE